MKDTLFSMANRMFRGGDYKGAVVIYDYLARRTPKFKPYALNRKLCWEQLVAQLGEAQEMPKSFQYKWSSDYQKRLRMADLVSQLGEPELIDVCMKGFEGAVDGQLALAKANAALVRDPDGWLASLNTYLAGHEVKPMVWNEHPKKGKAFIPFLALRSTNQDRVEGPLVTVCVSCYNAEAYVRRAIGSLLDQSYRSLEILAFNDCSTDGTLGILRELEKTDPRLTVIDNKKNSGTYVNRNKALKRAKGEFFTVLDGDDFALPERIAYQVGFLSEHPELAGMFTEWIRMDLSGRFVFKASWGGVYQHEAVATMMVRTQRARDQVGYWDSVRIAADTEYLFRLRRVFGEDSVPLLKRCTVLSLFHDESLTNHPVTGIDVGDAKGLSPVRVTYRKNWQAWHENAEKLFLEFPLKQRRFEAPAEMLP